MSGHDETTRAPSRRDLAADLGELRRTFDEALARTPVERASGGDDLLLVRVGDDRFALRLRELAGIELDRKILRLPGSRPELAGVAAIRGQTVAVFSLGTLVGSDDRGQRRWVALAAGDRTCAFAFSELEGHVRVTAADISTAARGGTHAPEVVRTAAGLRSVLSIASVLREIESRSRPKNRGAVG